MSVYYENIILVSTNHQINDDMIFFRYAQTLKNNTKKVFIIGVDYNCDKDYDKKIEFVILKKRKNRIGRFIFSNKEIFDYIRTFDWKNTLILTFSPDICLISNNLMKKKYKIIQVFVENYPNKIYSKNWIPKFLRPIVSKYIYKVQSQIGNKCYANIFVDSKTLELFSEIKQNKYLLPNYPLKEEAFKINILTNFDLPIKMVYTGGLSSERGFFYMMKLAEIFKEKIVLHLYGKASNLNDQEKFTRIMSTHSNIIYHGFIDNHSIQNELPKYNIGLAFYETSIGYANIFENTTKIFEYMKHGLPIICSNTGYLKQIIQDDNCGICIDLFDEKIFVTEINNFINNTSLLKSMSISCVNSFMNKRNWDLSSNILKGLIKKNGAENY